jgi:L-rhamnose isomerase
MMSVELSDREMYCQRNDAPAGSQWLNNVRAYEKDVLSARG